MLGTGLILYLLSKEIYVITAETFSAISTIGVLVYIVKKYGASIGAFADKLNEVRTVNLISHFRLHQKHQSHQVILLI